ncbi:MAG: hypothetical protein HWE33_14970 [Rhodobacteraceae bacterium]|nr:hypothetical protein [Paracoccaceae bacterium]
MGPPAPSRPIRSTTTERGRERTVMGAEREAEAIFARLRAARWAVETVDRVSTNPYGSSGLEDDQRLRAWAHLARVYNMETMQARRQYRRDIEFLRDVLTHTAEEIGERSDAMMEDVRGRLSESFLHGPVNDFDPSGRTPPLTSLARSLAAYTVACSDAPYPYLEEDLSRLSATPPGPEVRNTLPAGVPEAPPPSTVSEMRDAGVPEPESGWAVQLPDRWRGWDSGRNPQVQFAKEAYVYVVTTDEDLRLATLTQDMRRPPSTETYDGHAITLLAGRFMTPRQLYLTLRSSPTARNHELRGLAERIDLYLAEGQREFRAAFRERDWQTLRPLLEAAKWSLFPNAQTSGGLVRYRGADAPLHFICDEIIDDLEGWTISDTILAVTIVASVALAFVSMGTSSIMAATAIRATAFAVDIGGVAVDLIVADQQNQQRATINRFAALDTALNVAAHPESLKARAAIGALSLLIPYALPRAISAVRGSLLSRALRRIPRGDLPPAVARAANATPVPPPPPAVTRTGQAVTAEARGTTNAARQASERGTGQAAPPRPRRGASATPEQTTATQATPTQTTSPSATQSSAAPTASQRTTRGTTRGTGAGTGRGRTQRGTGGGSGRGFTGPAPAHVPNPPGSGQRYIDAATASYGNAPIMSPRTAGFLSDFDRAIAGTGGIRKIIAGRTLDGRSAFRIIGEILPGRLRRRAGRLLPGQTRAPNFNNLIRGANMLGPIRQLAATLKGTRTRLGGRWQWLHLWGPGFGDEAAAGMMIGLRSVNLQLQNLGIEDTIRGLATRARAAGGRLELVATAEAWGRTTPAGFTTPSGAEFLHSAEYRFWIVTPNGTREAAFLVNITCPDPGDVIGAIRAGTRLPRAVVSEGYF